MNKRYEEPEMLIRNYALLPGDIVKTSDPSDHDEDLNDGDDYDYFG